MSLEEFQLLDNGPFDKSIIKKEIFKKYIITKGHN